MGVIGGWGCRLAVRAHTDMQICQCPLSACLCVYVRRHVWHAVTFLPLLSAPRPSTGCNPYSVAAVRCLVSSFCFQTGVKETNHLHTVLPSSSPAPAFPLSLSPHSQQINGHKAFLPARRWDGAKFTSRRLSGAGAGHVARVVCIAPKIIAHINC